MVAQLIRHYEGNANARTRGTHDRKVYGCQCRIFWILAQAAPHAHALRSSGLSYLVVSRLHYFIVVVLRHYLGN
jgi:hypothetical protein